jgi:riboflavin biosynthesis pyrimidine reductase
MLSSVDGSVQSRRWAPRQEGATLFEKLHEEMDSDAWLVGRTTGAEFARRDEPYPAYDGPPIPREDWMAVARADAWGVVLDAHGKIAWGMSDIGGDPIVVVLTRQVSDRHLAGLRADNVSYLFGGEETIDLPGVLETLNTKLGVERLMMEGGGGANGAMLRAGLIDALHLVVVPAVDGARTSPHVFDVDDAEDGALPIREMTLEDAQPLEHGCVLLKYRFRYG